MRRILLVLTFMSFAAWSQPTQQQAQPPIVINNVPPHEGFWTGLLKLAIPTIVAAALASGITLYGVNRTHKHQAAENEANRTHLLQVEIAKAEIAAKHRSQDRRWEFRKYIHVNLIKATTDQNSSTKDMAKTFMNYHEAKEATPVNQATLQRCGKNMQMALDKLTDANRTFDIYSNLAPLAMADDVLPLISAIQNARSLSVSGSQRRPV